MTTTSEAKRSKNGRALGLMAFVGIFAGCLGFGAGYLVFLPRAEDPVDKVVAVKWGDGKYGKAFYGAEVYLVPVGAGKFDVEGRIWIGRGNGMWQDLGTLARGVTEQAAVAQWGEITWSPAGVTIGPGNPTPLVVPHATIEEHR